MDTAPDMFDGRKNTLEEGVARNESDSQGDAGGLERPFYFETDHLALKSTPDYHALLKTVAVLEAQRLRAVQDLDRLLQCRDEALRDPISFVHSLQHKVDLGLPKQQRVAEMPSILWENYSSHFDAVIPKSKHMTRHRRHTAITGPLQSESKNSFCTEPGTTEDNRLGSLVRGRIKDESKSETFNQLWTTDEQRKLEELLIKHPPEDIELRRWEKIASQLDNRTTHQVQSRVQKYFIKLAKSGLPVPGRLPNLALYSRKGTQRHHNRLGRTYFQPSTFLTSHVPPVYMSDDDDVTDSGSYSGSASGNVDSGDFSESGHVSDEGDIAEELRRTTEYEELQKLKWLRRQKAKNQGRVQHTGYKCDRCNCEPIIGTRWHCSDCPEETAVDFCDNCVDSVYETHHHNSSHRLQPIRSPPSVPHMDQDYMKFMPGDYNYLDPNYMPAS